MKPIVNTKQKAYQKLHRIIGEGVEAKADSISIEYADGGLEVCYRFADFGIGSVCVERSLEAEVIRLIVDKAGIEYKSRGTMKWKIRERELNIIVEKYDSFGESAYRLILKKPQSEH